MCDMICSWSASINHVDKREGMGVSEKTMFVHMGERGLDGCPRGQKRIAATRFLRENLKKYVEKLN